MVTKKTKIVGFASALFFGITCLVLLGMGRYIQTKGNELLQQSKEIANHEARTQKYNELEKLVEDTKENREELSTYVLTEDKTIDFLSIIEKIAVEQGVELVTDSLKVVEQDELFDTLVISFSVLGPKERAYTMLQIFETLPYHAFVSGISFVFDADAPAPTAEGTIELTVSLLNYDR
jgi:hypothetical protein